jgi:hypothetical protein
MISIPKLAKSAEKFVIDNSPAILSAIGVAGTITTAALAARSGFQASAVLAETPEAGTIQDKFIVTWQLYIPPVLSGLGTVAAVIAANQVSSRRAAALAAAYSLTEKAYAEYKDKVVHEVGEKKETAIRDAIAQDRVNATPVGRSDLIVTGGGEVLCFEMYTGRYFRSSMEAIKKAQNEVNYDVLNNYYASLSDFYTLIGLPHTKVSDEVGWNSDSLMEIIFSTTMGENDQPCIAIDYQVEPIRNYHRVH